MPGSQCTAIARRSKPVNRLAPYLLVASLAFLGGRASVTGFSFDFGSIVAPIAKPQIGGVYVIEDVSDRTKVVAKMMGADWFNDMERKHKIICEAVDDGSPTGQKYKSEIEAVGGVAAVVVVDQAGKVIDRMKLEDGDKIEAIEDWITEVGRYAN